MKLTIVQHAEDGLLFAPTAFDSQIGKDVPVRFDSKALPGRVVAAQVSQDGTTVELTVDFAEPPAFGADTLVRLGEWSIGVPSKPFTPPDDWRDHL